MNSSPIAPSVGELLALGVFGLIPAILGLVVTYFVIRLAVRHALRDAARQGDLPGTLDRR